MRYILMILVIYHLNPQPFEITKWCDVYEIANVDGIEVLICYDNDYVVTIGNRNVDEVEEDAEPVPRGLYE